MIINTNSATASRARIRLMYKTIIVAIISSILITPIALVISYRFSKARYDRIVYRQVMEFSNDLFSKVKPASPAKIYTDVIKEYLSNKELMPSTDANFVYILLTDEFDQEITKYAKSDQEMNIFSKKMAIECTNSIIPIVSYGNVRFFCSKNSIANGHTHYTIYGYLRASDVVISDFVFNTLLLCGITSLIVIIVSFIQYYVSIKVSKTLVKANVKTLFLLGNTIALRDNDTFHHNLRVMIYSYHFGSIMGLSDVEMSDLINGALLHDIGKIGIPDAVLQKPGKLDKSEFEVIKGHVQIGERLIKTSEWAESGIEVIKYHHERFDGGGYPENIFGHHIPLIARMFAIIDVFDAITSKRPYKEPKSYEDTMTYLISQKGGHFDPELVDKFMDISRMLFENYANRNDEVINFEANRILNVYYG